MKKQSVTVRNAAGLHARPASVLVRVASKFQSEFYISMHGYKVNGKSILGVLTLAAEQGAELQLVCEGPDEEEAVDTLARLFEKEFKENTQDV